MALFLLHQGKDVHLANVSFSAIEGLPLSGPDREHSSDPSGQQRHRVLPRGSRATTTAAAHPGLSVRNYPWYGSVSVTAWSTEVKILAVAGTGKGNLVNSLNKGVRKAEVTLRWDPSPLGEPAHDLDIVAATYRADATHGEPAYVVHFDSRSPDGTIILTRDSTTGQGFGSDEVMTLEFDRLAATYGRVVVGVAIQQREGRRVFADIANTLVRVFEGHTELGKSDFASVLGSTAAVVGEFIRSEAGEWEFHLAVRGFDADPQSFVEVMGGSTY